MDGAPTALEIRLRPRGGGRFASAAFLLFWLCGWLAGELFVLWVLNNGAVALVTGTPPKPVGQPLELGPALAVGCFFLLWLSFWTLGGIAAIQELLRLVWSEDRLAVGADSLHVEQRLGPFRSRRELARDSIHRIDLGRHRELLTAWTRESSVELSGLGTREERRAAAAALREALSLPERSEQAVPPSLPDGWEEILTPECERALVPSRRRRRFQALLASAGTLLLFLAALGIALDAPAGDPALPIALCFLGMGGLAGYGALWLARGRREWVIGPGELRLRRRFGARSKELARAGALELEVETDSDGDEWFQLVALGQRARDGSTRRFRILTTLHDPTEPRQLGAWLARATGLTLTDRAVRADPPTAETLRARLEEAGALARWVARWLRPRD